MKYDTYKIGFSLDAPSLTNQWESVVANDTYAINIPFKLFEILQRYDGSKQCKILLQHFFMTNGSTEPLGDSGIKIMSEFTLNSSNQINSLDSGINYDSYRTLAICKAEFGKNQTKTVFYFSNPSIQPVNDFSISTSVASLSNPTFRLILKRLVGSSTNFAPSANTKLDLSLVVLIEE